MNGAYDTRHGIHSIVESGPQGIIVSNSQG